MFARSSCQLFRVPHISTIRISVRPRQLLDVQAGSYIKPMGQIVPKLYRQFQKPRTYPAGWTYFQNFWRDLFGRYLLATNILSSGILMVVGDLAAQEFEYHRHPPGSNAERYNFERIWEMFIVGAMQGPLHHYVYMWMDRIMPVANFRNALKKILIDQFFMSPACICMFFYTACYMEHKSLKDTNSELIEKFPIIYITDWMVWPAVQYINFRYLDTKYRVLFVNGCTALYNIFLSYMKHDFGIQLS